MVSSGAVRQMFTEGILAHMFLVVKWQIENANLQIPKVQSHVEPGYREQAYEGIQGGLGC